jgi:hypothetical protein
LPAQASGARRRSPFVLERERGKRDATLIGDGRELNGVELSLKFDTETGGWSIIAPRPEPLARTPEREKVVRVLIEYGPQDAIEISARLGWNINTTRSTLRRMLRAGEIVQVKTGIYRAPDSAGNSGNSSNFSNSSIEEDEEDVPAAQYHPHHPMREEMTELPELLELPGMSKSSPPPRRNSTNARARPWYPRPPRRAVHQQGR